MKLKRICSRFSPPGLIFESSDGLSRSRTDVHLPHLRSWSSVNDEVSRVSRAVPEASRQTARLSRLIQQLISCRRPPPRLQRGCIRPLPLQPTNVSFATAGMSVPFEASLSCIQYMCTRLVCGCYDRRARVFSSTGSLLATLEGHSDVVFDVTFVRTRVVTGALDGVLRVWSGPWQEGCCSYTAECELVLQHHTAAVTAVTALGDSSVVSGSLDTAAVCWDLEYGEATGLLVGHSAAVVALQARDTSLLTASFDGTARLWDLRTHKSTHAVGGKDYSLNTATLHPAHCGMLATAATDATARVWDLRRPDHVVLAVHHEAEVLDVAWDVGGHQLATAGLDGKAIVTRVEDGTHLATLHAHQEYFNRVIFSSRDDQVLVTCGSDQSVTLWGLPSGTLLQREDLEGPLDTLAQSTDGATIAACRAGNYTALCFLNVDQ
ncbi:WD40 repeat [Trinorchestia longiramus]|nr:WD40 repeat [Trinorchestia longiramus]